MTEEHRRLKHAGNAAAGLALVAGGEGVGHAVSRSATGRAGHAAAHVLPRGMKVVGIPLAATGLVGAARDRGRSKKVDVRGLSRDVARRTVEVPKLKREPKSQRAKDAGLATLAGAGGGTLMRAGGRTPAGRIAMGTAGAAGFASSTLYGRQKGREAGRKVKVGKADRPQKVVKIPAPTVADTVEDWKVHRQRRHAANFNAAATGIGAAALAARAPSLLRNKKAGAKLIKLKAHGDRASNVLGGTAAGAYVAGGAINYKTQRHDLGVQRRRLVERDQALQGVRKDRFTSKYGQHISPEAEAGYDYLRRGRNKKAGHAVLAGALTGVNTHAAVRGGRIGRPVGAGLAVLTGTSAVSNYRGAKRWNGHMKKIKAKAYERAAVGELGRGREVHTQDLAKALVQVRPPGLPFPKGLRRAPTVRSGSVRRTAGGKMVAFRGSYG